MSNYVKKQTYSERHATPNKRSVCSKHRSESGKGCIAACMLIPFEDSPFSSRCNWLLTHTHTHTEPVFGPHLGCTEKIYFQALFHSLPTLGNARVGPEMVSGDSMTMSRALEATPFRQSFPLPFFGEGGRVKIRAPIWYPL